MAVRWCAEGVRLARERGLTSSSGAESGRADCRIRLRSVRELPVCPDRRPMTNPLSCAGSAALLAVSCILSPSIASAQGSELSPREREFAEHLTGARLVGAFTSLDSDGPPKTESYRIDKVRKRSGNNWSVVAEIVYAGKKPVKVPVTVQVEWAGDTPMIQVTDLSIPLMGTFTARVGFYGGQYFGMWSGGDHGGQMFGQVVRDVAPEDATASSVGTWSNWRGPLYSGAAPTATPPVSWSEDENLVWKQRLPGTGHATPIVWGDKIFLTVAIETDETVQRPEAEEREEPRRRRRGRGRRPDPITNVYRFAALALDRTTGKPLWQTDLVEAVPHEAGHRTASQASSSPVTDGERVYVHLGSRGLHAVDFDGNVVWSTDLGKMKTRNAFGEGSSPALSGNTLVVNWDHEGPSFVVALDKSTGEELWRKERDEPTSWATPVIVDVDGRKQVVVAGTNRSRGYDLETGDVVWSVGGMTTNVIPSPIPSGDIVYLMSGFRGNALQALRLAGTTGDLGEGDAHDRFLWTYNEPNTSYTPSAALYDGRLYFLRGNQGVLSCLDAATGGVVFEGERLGVRAVYSSPVAANGHVYITARDGTTLVVKAGDEFEVVAKNKLEDEIDASAVILGDRIYLRGHQSLYCIGAGDT